MPAEAAEPRTVLVTGANRSLAALAAARLAAEPTVSRVLAVDTTPPQGKAAALLFGRPAQGSGTAGSPRRGDERSAGRPPNPKIEFVRADIRDPGIAKVMVEAEVDTVVHLAVGNSSSRPEWSEMNVIGTMQLLAACQKSPTLRRLVVRSSVAAYGASARDPAMFGEDTPPRAAPRRGYGKDVLEVEKYARGFSRRRPEATVTVLRFAPFVGPQADTTLTRYLALPVVPTVLGHDPRMQFIHSDDALEVLHRATVGDHRGVYNVAGDGVLLLSQAIRRAGRAAVPVPGPGLSALTAFARRSGLFDFPAGQLDFLVHSPVVDTTRLVARFNYQPRPTTEAFDDFVRHQDPTGQPSVAHVERALLGHIRASRLDATPTGGER